MQRLIAAKVEGKACTFLFLYACQNIDFERQKMRRVIGYVIHSDKQIISGATQDVINLEKQKMTGAPRGVILQPLSLKPEDMDQRGLVPS